MRRREFLVLSGVAASWALAAHAEPSNRVRRVGILLPAKADDPEYRTRIAAFRQGLQQLGWIEGSNLLIDTRWAAGNADTIHRYAVELAGLAPDIILAVGSATTGQLLRATHSTSIVFVLVPDPVGAGYVESLARPGGNATGFTPFEYSMGGKWVELLKEIAPHVTRIGVLRNSAIAAGIGQFGAIQSVALSLGMEIRPLDVRNAPEIERAVVAFARSPNAGLILTGSSLATIHRNLIIKLAADHNLPTVYFARYFAAGGGLISYGPDLLDQFRRAADYVSRILNGEKPAELPVQAPTKYDLAINLKSAKALKLIVPPGLLARADSVIE